MTDSTLSPAAPPALERDRLPVHLVWEAILAFLTIGVVIALFATVESISLSVVLGRTAVLGLTASAIGVSLRTASPNLAVGTIGVMTGAIGAELAGSGGLPLAAGMAIAVLIAVVVSVLIGLITAGLGAPAWATTLGAAVIIAAILIATVGPRGSLIADAGGGAGVLWFIVFLLVSVGGAAAWWLVPGLRQFLSANRSAPPGRWPGLRAGIGVVAGITVSGLLAALAGVVNALQLRAVFVVDGGFSIVYLAFGAVLLGGTSIAGRRAGMFGTLLACLLLMTATILAQVEESDSVLARLLPGLAIIAGLGIGRAIEAVSAALDRLPR